jgi:hypothetical protein
MGKAAQYTESARAHKYLKYWTICPEFGLARVLSALATPSAGRYHCHPAKTHKNAPSSRTNAPVAQLDRVSASEAEGHWFESSRARQISCVDIH